MAETWDQRFYTPELKAHLIHRLLPLFHLRPGSRVLDVGGGTGGMIPHLLQVVGSQGSIWSIDYAEKMVEIGMKKFGHEPRVYLQVASVEKLPFEDEFFDHVVCYGAFPHFDNQPRALGEMNRVLKVGRTLIIAHALSSEEIKSHHKTASPVSRDCLPEEEEMRRLMENAGFQVLRLIDKPKCYLCEILKIS